MVRKEVVRNVFVNKRTGQVSTSFSKEQMKTTNPEFKDLQSKLKPDEKLAVEFPKKVKFIKVKK